MQRSVVSLVLGAIFGWCCHAEAQTPTLHYTLAAREVVAGTTNLVANPNGVVDPGEGVLFQLSLAFDPPVGTVVTVPGGLSGPVVGFGAAHVELQGAGGAQGEWAHFTQAPGWNPFGILSPGVPGFNGTRLSGIQFGQTPSFSPISSQNPIENIWRGVWTPYSYAARAVDWDLQSTGTGAAFGSLWFQYGIDPTTGLPLYSSIGVPQAASGSINISIVPTPGGAVAFIFALGFAARRRR